MSTTSGERVLNRLGRSAGTGSARQRGMVTAELAVSILAVLALLTLVCWGIFLLVMQVRLIDVAGEVARQSARGDTEAVDRARREAPPGTKVEVRVRGGVAQVRVRLEARPWTDGMASVPLSSSAEVAVEPGVGAS